MAFQLPPKSHVGVLDPELAGEGQKVVILSDGEQVPWSPPPPQPVMPDWSQIKSIRHLFGRVGHKIYPAWLYNKDGSSALVKDADEATKLGVYYRKATNDEIARYGLKEVWDWDAESDWRPKPWSAPKFDPAHAEHGKTVVASAPNPAGDQSRLIAELIPAVAAAVAASLKANGPAAPANIDPKQWDQFIEFQAWQQANAAAQGLARADVPEEPIEPEEEPAPSALNALSPEQERLLWEEEAKRIGVKVDGRWSLDRLKSEVDKAQKAA